MEPLTYDPKSIVLSIAGLVAHGFPDGTFLKIMRKSKTFESYSGTDGEVTRVKQHDRSGSMTLSLAQSSSYNDMLSALALADENSNSGVGVVPFIGKDITGTTILFAGACWIVKPAEVEYGKSVAVREWEFDLARLEVFVGGH